MSEMIGVAALRQRIENDYNESPQRQRLAKVALDHIQEALDDLARLGYLIGVGFADKPEPVEFPKMLYTKDGAERVVASQEEESAAKKDGFSLREAAKAPEPEREVPSAPPPVVEKPNPRSTHSPRGAQ